MIIGDGGILPMTNQNEMVRTGLAPQSQDTTLSKNLIDLDISAPPPSADDAFLAWEKMRLAYNVILVGVVLMNCACFSRWSLFQNLSCWWYLACCVVAANVCFCVGPWIEGWLSIAGADRHLVRWLLFLPGVILAW